MLNHQVDLSYYEVFPKVVMAGRETKITIRPRGDHVKFEDREYAVIPIPLDQHIEKAGPALGAFEELAASYLTVRPDKGVITFYYTFEREQEYDLCVCLAEEMAPALVQLSIYCVAEDLYELFPYKIETHSHTNCSDGMESPEFIPPYYRRYGYDAMAITDHGKYDPSLRAIEAFENLKMDFRIYPGEEVHAPYNTIHIVNFGGNTSVNKLFQDDFEKYDEEVKEIMRSMDIPQAFDQYKVASCVWVSREIRKAGGLCILCHPYWRPTLRETRIKDESAPESHVIKGVKINYNISTEMTLYLLGLGIFDAWEICGFSSDRNNGHLGLYLESLRRGISIPVLGANDSHGVVKNNTYFNNAYTIVFSRQNHKDEFISRIKEGYSVAAERRQEGTDAVYGRNRLILYAKFLLRNYYPIHNMLCMQEGQLLMDYAAGVSGAREELNRIGQRIKDYREHFFKGKEIRYY